MILTFPQKGKTVTRNVICPNTARPKHPWKGTGLRTSTRDPGQEARISQLATDHPLQLLSSQWTEEERGFLPQNLRIQTALPCSLSILWLEKQEQNLLYHFLLLCWLVSFEREDVQRNWWGKEKAELLDWLLRSPVMEHGQSGVRPVWSSGPHLLESTIDPIVSSGSKILCLNIFKQCLSVRKPEWMLDIGHTDHLGPPGSWLASPLRLRATLFLYPSVAYKYYDFSMCSRP